MVWEYVHRKLGSPPPQIQHIAEYEPLITAVHVRETQYKSPVKVLLQTAVGVFVICTILGLVGLTKLKYSTTALADHAQNNILVNTVIEREKQRQKLSFTSLNATTNESTVHVTEEEEEKEEEEEERARVTVRHYDWVIRRNVQTIIKKSYIVNTVNGDIRSPIVHVAQGDILSVNVTNELTDDMVSIHWHGFMMKGHQVYDGVVGLTQCGIGPGESYLYRFVVDEMPGTYLWHTHSGFPVVGQTFIRGPLIVHPKGTNISQETLNVNKYQFNKEKVLLFQDLYPTWIREDHIYALGGLEDYAMKDREGFYESPFPWSGGLINGRQTAIINVTAGLKYRFRIINAGFMFAYIFSIDEHQLTVVATDGADVKPYAVDAITIHLGERYDFEITFAKSTLNKKVWLRGDTLSQKAGIFACIHIHGSNNYKDPFTKEIFPNSSRHINPITLNCMRHVKDDRCKSITELTPVTSKVPNLTNPEIHIVDWDDGHAPKYAHFVSIDGSAFQQHVLPHKPMIRKDFTDTDLHVNSNVLKLKLNKTVVIVMRSATTFPHPIHMHGHKFEVLEVVARRRKFCPDGSCAWHDYNKDFSVPLSELARQPTIGVLKDTVIIPTGGMIALRFRSENPGAWLMHCHLDEHLEDGQGFIIDEGGWKTDNYPADYPSCDYTGRIQIGPDDSCECFQSRYAFRPEAEVKDAYRCSKKYLCGYTNKNNEQTFKIVTKAYD